MGKVSKPIVISDHASQRMALRSISHNQLVNTIRQPKYRRAGNASYTQRLEREFPPNRLLVVMVEELGDSIQVITTYFIGRHLPVKPMAMSIEPASSGFGLTVSAREDGSLRVAYVQISANQVARTEELVESTLLIDVDHDGKAVGIEILAPVRMDEILGLAERLDVSQREAFKNFIAGSVPPALVTT